MDGRPPISPKDLFLLLEYLLRDGSIRTRKEARPVAFEMLPSGGIVYCLDPHAPGALFTRGNRNDVALRLRCEPELLLRALTDPCFELRPEDRLGFEGDLGQLRIIGKSMQGKKSFVGIRAVRGDQR